MSVRWTFEDRNRLLAEAFRANDKDLISRILHSDNFEPSLGAPGGLATLIVVTPEQKREERKRIAEIKAEWKAIKERWASAT